MIPRTARPRLFLVALTALALYAVTPLTAQESTFLGDFVDTQGGRVFFETHGSGPPTVLIHGGMVDRTMWDAQMEVWGESLLVIRFDMRGAGRSPVSEPYLPAEDVIALLDHLGIDRANVVGLSNGGAVAVDLVLAHPGRVASLVLAEPAVTGFQFNPRVQESVMRAATQMRERDFPGAVQTLLSSGAFSYAREHNPTGFQQIQQMVTSNLQSFAMFPRYRWHEANAFERLGNISVPTLILVSEHAEEDALTIAAEITQQVPNVQRATVSDAGHMMNIDNPSDFNQKVLRFLRPSP